ncbi:MAG: stage V sporulation protein D, partial [Clostridiales bacterium]|nr:stage V sporulation protein D [Clostridiales bacterium]
MKIKNRLNRVVIFFILLGFATLIGRLFYLSVIQNDFFQTKASNQQMRDITINANRGTIYDRNMKVLAQSAT